MIITGSMIGGTIAIFIGNLFVLEIICIVAYVLTIASYLVARNSKVIGLDADQSRVADWFLVIVHGIFIITLSSGCATRQDVVNELIIALTAVMTGVTIVTQRTLTPSALFIFVHLCIHVVYANVISAVFYAEYYLHIIVSILAYTWLMRACYCVIMLIFQIKNWNTPDCGSVDWWSVMAVGCGILWQLGAVAMAIETLIVWPTTPAFIMQRTIFFLVQAVPSVVAIIYFLYTFVRDCILCMRMTCQSIKEEADETTRLVHSQGPSRFHPGFETIKFATTSAK